MLAWAQANLARALRVDDLARRAAMSPRTFARQFVLQNGTTPHQWLMHQRVLAAQRRLEKTAESIDRVAASVGLESAARSGSTSRAPWESRRRHTGGAFPRRQRLGQLRLSRGGR